MEFHRIFSLVVSFVLSPTSVFPGFSGIRALQVEHETLFAELFGARMAYVGKTKVENTRGVVDRVLACHGGGLRFDSS